LSHKACISAAQFELGIGLRKKDSTGQEKSYKRVIFHLFGEKPPIKAIYIKNCVIGDVLDVITCAKVLNEMFRGYGFTGVVFSIFLLIFEWDLQ